MGKLFKSKPSRKDSRITYNDLRLQEALVKLFLRYLPRNLEWAIQNNAGKDIKKICDHFDMVEFHYRHYVIGVQKTLHRVMFELRLLCSHQLYEAKYMEKLFKLVEDDILEHELYELMPRHMYAIKRIKLYELSSNRLSSLSQAPASCQDNKREPYQ